MKKHVLWSRIGDHFMVLSLNLSVIVNLIAQYYHSPVEVHYQSLNKSGNN